MSSKTTLSDPVVFDHQLNAFQILSTPLSHSSLLLYTRRISASESWQYWSVAEQRSCSGHPGQNQQLHFLLVEVLSRKMGKPTPCYLKVFLFFWGFFTSAIQQKKKKNWKMNQPNSPPATNPPTKVVYHRSSWRSAMGQVAAIDCSVASCCAPHVWLQLGNSFGQRILSWC